MPDLTAGRGASDVILPSVTVGAVKSPPRRGGAGARLESVSFGGIIVGLVLPSHSWGGRHGFAPEICIRDITPQDKFVDVITTGKSYRG